ncbi:MAG: ABC-F type ribosomal protection protein [Clostridia bacterium]|nr:ABC-F type ribosomal protection protein [Clostridia bacterium]
MSLITVNNLTFQYEGSISNIFENVTFHIDTDWKLGLIGRNGKGKTTFLKLLMGEYEYKGNITKSVEFDYFPYEVKNKEKMTIEIINQIVPQVEDWEIIKELNLLNTSPEILYRAFQILSGGEQIKVLLASLFLKENHFLLIDEPTNHLDCQTRDNLVEYLNKKKGFILVSHDRKFLDKVVDHIISINNTNIDIQKENFSSWQENKDAQDKFELTQNEKLQKDIVRLEIASKNTANWSNKIEKSKYNTTNSGSSIDRGYVGHQSAKMMKKSKVIEKRIGKSIEQKSNLLHNIDKNASLKIIPKENRKNPLIIANNLQIIYQEKAIFHKTSFEIKNGDRIAITGKNGVGKSSLLKLIMGDNIPYIGNLKLTNDLITSYVSQSTEQLKGKLKEFSRKSKIDEGVFKAMLSKMGFSGSEFEKDISQLSEGQKKKIMLAKSISETANIYIWDEPLNYIDILTRIQIEEAILKYRPTIVFVEHDEAFIKKVVTRVVALENNLL